MALLRFPHVLELSAKVNRAMRDFQWPPRAFLPSRKSQPAQVVPSDSKQPLTGSRGKRNKYRPPELTLAVGWESHVKYRFTLYSRGKPTASQSATPTSQTKAEQSTPAKESPGATTLQPKVSNEVTISVEHFN